jgi:hypothetical protein
MFCCEFPLFRTRWGAATRESDVFGGYLSEIKHRFCEFDPYLCAAFVTQTKTDYSAMSFRPILGILEHQPLAYRHTSC